MGRAIPRFARDVEQRVRAERFGQARKMQRIEIETLQRRFERGRVLGQELGDVAGRRLQAGQQFGG